MRAEIVKIGNSQGLRLPKAILEQCGFETAVELRVEGNCLVVQPLSEARQGWDEAFAAALTSFKDETLLLENGGEIILNDFDEEEWTW